MFCGLGIAELVLIAHLILLCNDLIHFAKWLQANPGGPHQTLWLDSQTVKIDEIVSKESVFPVSELLRFTQWNMLIYETWSLISHHFPYN